MGCYIFSTSAAGLRPARKSHPYGRHMGSQGTLSSQCVLEDPFCAHHTNLGLPSAALLLPHIYIPHSMTSACGGRLIGSYGLSWVTPHPAGVVWALPLSLLLSFPCSHSSPSELGRPDSPPFRSDHPHPCAALLPAIPRWRRPVAPFTDLPSHRDLLGWSPDPVGIIPFRWS